MLRVDVRELRHGPMTTSAALAPDHPLWRGVEVELAEPLRVEGRLEATGREDFVWHGRLTGRARVSPTAIRPLGRHFTPLPAQFVPSPSRIRGWHRS